MPSDESLLIDYSGLEFDEPPAPQQPVRIEVGTVTDRTANDALVAALTSLSDRLQASEERQAEIVDVVKQLAGMVNADREYLVASLDALSAALRDQPAPVVNVEVPAFPEIPAPVVNVPEPVVHVTVAQPPTHKRLKIQRDPLTNLLASAEIEEMSDGS